MLLFPDVALPQPVCATLWKGASIKSRIAKSGMSEYTFLL